MRTRTKSVLEVAHNALAAGEMALPSYASRFSRHDHTQPQLFALLVPWQFLRTNYRGIVTLAGEWRKLREALGLTGVPHCSTLACVASRLMVGAEKGGRSGAPKRR